MDIKLQIKKIGADIVCKYLKNNPTLFSTIEIETVNRCNGKCSFCPVNRRLDSRPFTKMDDDLFKKIINELSNIRYTGTIGLQSNNEPLLDKNIISKLNMIKAVCPTAITFMYTNGTLLTVEKMMQILDAGVKIIQIDNYNDQLVMHENIRLIDQHFRMINDNRYLSNVKIIVQSENIVRTNRGGNAPNKTPIENKEYLMFKNTGCLLPFRQLVVRPDGKVSLCCQDAFGKVTLGDCKKQTLLEIWSGDKYSQLRKELHKNGRKNLSLCKNCDVLQFSVNNFNLIFNRLLGRDIVVVDGHISKGKIFNKASYTSNI